MVAAMCMIKPRVAEQLKAYRHERVTDRSSVTDKETVTKNCMCNCIIKTCEIMSLNYGELLFAANFITVVNNAC